jgi:hypothetical protein
MCVIHENTRMREVMSLDYFKKVVDRFLPYKEYFNFVTLHGCGEPLLDKTISEKVHHLRKMGFRGIGFASNCQALSEELSKKLLSAGLDTLLVSIDGFSKLVQERIRIGTDFDTIVGNVQKYISLRNTMNYSGRVLIRFIRQQANFSEWPDFKAFWCHYIDKAKGDDVIKFDIHNCGARISDYENMKVIDIETNETCCDVFERIIVFASGAYGFCSADQSGYFDLGNVLDNDPTEVFNNSIFSHYRERMLAHDMRSLQHCCTCSLPLSRYFKDRPNEGSHR